MRQPRRRSPRSRSTATSAITGGGSAPPGGRAGRQRRSRPTRWRLVANGCARAASFRSVEVLKRFASIADAVEDLLVIIVDEGDVKIEWDQGSGAAPRTVRRRGPPLMFLPVLDVRGRLRLDLRRALCGCRIRRRPRSRLAVPADLGRRQARGRAAREGLRREGRSIASPPACRCRGASTRSTSATTSGCASRSRAERDLAPKLRAGAHARHGNASTSSPTTRTVLQTGVDLVLDTRARSGARAQCRVSRAPPGIRYAVTDAEAYRQVQRRPPRLRRTGRPERRSVARVYRTASDQALPPFLQPILGGMDNLRGFRAGTAVGDTLVGRLRRSANADHLAAEFREARRQRVRRRGDGLRSRRAAGATSASSRGFGGSVWLSAAFFRLNLAVAHGMGSSTRVHFGTSFSD